MLTGQNVETHQSESEVDCSISPKKFNDNRITAFISHWESTTHQHSHCCNMLLRRVWISFSDLFR